MTSLKSLLWLGVLLLPGLAHAGWNQATHTLAVGDFNGDGRQDVLYVAKDPLGASGIALSDANGPNLDLQTWTGNYLGIPWYSGIYRPVVGDFTGDGRADILMQRQTAGDHYLLAASSDGKILGIAATIGQYMLGYGWSGDQHRLVAGNFDGDADTDLFFQAATLDQSNYVTKALSGFQFSTAQSWGNLFMGFQWALPKSMVYAGDFNGDGRSDLIVQGRPDVTLVDYQVPIPVARHRPGANGVIDAKLTSVCGAIFCGTALQIFDHDFLGYEWSANDSTIIVGDFNGDGKDDILLQSGTSIRPNMLFLASGSNGQFTAATGLNNAQLAAMLSGDYQLLAIRYGTPCMVNGFWVPCTPAGIYAVASQDGGISYLAANVTGAGLAVHDANLINAITPGTAVGSIPGEFSVDPSGAASYRIPIAASPGVAGVAPELALTYSSRGGNGLVGAGMSLEGLSVITRCGRSIDPDGYNDGADFDSNDAFCIDGQRLIVRSGTYGAIGSEYRTEIESFRKVVSTNGSTGNPESFTVYDKAGLIYEYGTSIDSRIQAVGCTTGSPVVTWALKLVKDRYNNFIRYYYGKSATATEYWPTTVEWGSNWTWYAGAGTVVGKMQFNTVDRSDISTGFLPRGCAWKSSKRLKSLRVFGRGDTGVSGANSPVRDYFIDYEQSPTTGLSHAMAVTMCSPSEYGSRQCFHSTKFEWEHGIMGFATEGQTAVTKSSMPAVRVADFNGDGRNDYLSSKDGDWRVRYGSITSSYQEFNSTNSSVAMMLDWNSDGISDIVERNNGKFRYFLGSANGLPSTPVVTTINAWALDNGSDAAAVGDFNGDGRQDIAYTNNGGDANETGTELSIQLGSANGIEGVVGKTVTFVRDNANRVPKARKESGSTVRVINFDNDGRDDILVTLSHMNFNALDFRNAQVYSIDDSGNLVRVWSSGTSDTEFGGIKPYDYNGDGITDLLYYKSSGWRLSLGTGTGYSETTNTWFSNSLSNVEVCKEKWARYTGKRSIFPVIARDVLM